MSKTLKVAAFRAEADHLFRLANVDYHACVGAHELEGSLQKTEKIVR